MHARDCNTVINLNPSLGRPWGQRNVVQAPLGRDTTASDAACAERCSLYSLVGSNTVATGNESRRAVMICGLVEPTYHPKASNISGGQESSELRAGGGTADAEVDIETNS